MTTSNQLGASTIAILEALDTLGQSTSRQVSNATDIDHALTRQYLRRCAFRGLLSVDYIGRTPVYTVKAGWRERLAPKPKPIAPPPETTVQRAIRARPVLQSIWQGAAQ